MTEPLSLPQEKKKKLHFGLRGPCFKLAIQSLLSLLVLFPLISCFCLSPGKSHGQRSLMGHRPWGWQESDVTSGLHHHQLTDSSLCRGRGAEEALFMMSTNSLTFQVHYAPNCRDSETRSVHFPDSRLV